MPHDEHEHETRKITDAQTLRALAHPVRIAIFEQLAFGGAMTATEIGEQIGESPTTCSFHLRQLAKYGFVEEAGGGRGRERPWRRIHAGLRIPDQHGSPQAAQAAGALRDFLAETLLERARSSLAQQSSWPAEWQAALEQGNYVSYLTTDEARQLTADLHEVLIRHSDRVDHPERRPTGAMPIEILAIAYPLLQLGQIATGERS